MSGKIAPLPRPFEVDYDPEEEEYYIFAPPGCVLVDGEAVEIEDADGKGNVALDLDPENLPDSLWAHVTKSSTATGGHKVEFDGNATKAGAKWNFRVMRFGAAENDGNQYDIATSVVSLGESERTVPDDVSTEFIPDPPEGEDPDGDEGKLQIKGFKAGSPADTHTIAEYLQGSAIPSGDGIWLIVRGKATGGSAAIGYIPLAALDLTVNDGTLTIKQGSTTLGTFTANQATGTTVTIPEPQIPTVNDGTLTIKQGTTTLGTFTANQSTGTTVTIPEPPTPPTIPSELFTAIT